MLYDYNYFKSELKKHANTKYFTREFFNDFLKAIQERKKAIANNIDMSYYKVINGNNILLYHYYDNIYDSKFYNNNGGAYCYFLQIAYKKIYE